MNKTKLKNGKENEKNHGGITLVALVITVVIMLILAGVAIAAVVNSDGLFDKTKQAAETYQNASEKEADFIDSLLTGDYINDVMNGDTTTGEGTTNEELLSIISDLTSRVENLENSGAGNILEAYPVGSIYLSTSETNPAELFGGTWEAYGQGRTLVGVGTGTDTRGEQLEFKIDQTGGEYNHVLSVQEMPSHNHTVTAITGTSSSKAVSSVSEGLGARSGNYLTSSSSSTPTTSNSGSSAAHNNIQPYITCYMWKRIS